LAEQQIGWLLDAGADPDGADSNGLTPLCNAASAQLHSLFVRLVAGGACGGQHTWVRVLPLVAFAPVKCWVRCDVTTSAEADRSRQPCILNCYLHSLASSYILLWCVRYFNTKPVLDGCCLCRLRTDSQPPPCRPLT
jgi:hypothetical protein